MVTRSGVGRAEKLRLDKIDKENDELADETAIILPHEPRMKICVLGSCSKMVVTAATRKRHGRAAR